MSDEDENDRSSVLQRKKQRKKKNNVKKQKLITQWSIIISILTFFTAIGVSLVSDFFLRGSSIWVALIVLFMIVAAGTITDILGVAITAAEIKPFNAMAAKKVYGARKSIHILQNAEKYSNFFNDVVGDVAGYVAGFAGATLVAQILILRESFHSFESLVTVLIAGITSSIIVGSKAVGKNLALNHSTVIVLTLGKVLTLISKITTWK